MNLMFDKKDVEEATHPLVRILRSIFYEKKITLDDFSTMFAQHGKRMGLAPHITNTNRNNARKALNIPDNMTFLLFQKILLNILYMDMVELGTTVYDQKTKEYVTYTYDVSTGKCDVVHHGSDNPMIKNKDPL